MQPTKINGLPIAVYNKLRADNYIVYGSKSSITALYAHLLQLIELSNKANEPQELWIGNLVVLNHYHGNVEQINELDEELYKILKVYEEQYWQYFIADSLKLTPPTTTDDVWSVAFSTTGYALKDAQFLKDAILTFYPDVNLAIHSMVIIKGNIHTWIEDPTNKYFKGVEETWTLMK